MDPRPPPSGLRKLLALAVVALLAAAAPAAAHAYVRNAQLERVASIFAMRPVEVRCPDSAEWGDFALIELGESDPQLVFGATHLREDWMMLRTDMCDAAALPGDEAVEPSVRALAVLTIVHEAYHVRRWSARRHEGQVQCQAIRHFRVGAQLLGASRAEADLLFPHALLWHRLIAGPETEYYWPRCVLPSRS